MNDQTNIELKRYVNDLLYEKRVSRIKTIIQDFNTELKLESTLGTQLYNDMKNLRNDRNDMSHCWLDTDSIIIKEYRMYESISLLEKLSPDLKDDIEHDFKYTKGFLDNIISQIRGKIGNNHKLDISKIDVRDIRQADRWFYCLK